ncbi:MAG: sulfite exporter TauE/SafE family protein, partial [Planctomycetota bacterium]
MPACCATGHEAVVDATGAAAGVATPWMMLLTMVPLMVAFHCAGMCGPLILSFRFGLDRSSRTARVAAASGHLLAYQLGRALLYAVFGAIVGGLGQVFAQRIQAFNKYLVLAIAAAFLLWGLYRFGLFRWLLPASGGQSLGVTGRLMTTLR